jgi:hypothetical protein
MSNSMESIPIAIGLAGAMTLALVAPLSAAPVPSATAVVGAQAPGHLTKVYWRGRWGWGGGGLVAAGLAAGFVGAAATAAYGGYYPYPAYTYPAYSYPAYSYPVYRYATYPAHAPHYVTRSYYAVPYWGGYRSAYWGAGFHGRPLWGYRHHAYWRRW